MGLISFHIGFNIGFDRVLRKLFKRKLCVKKPVKNIPDIKLQKPKILTPLMQQ